MTLPNQVFYEYLLQKDDDFKTYILLTLPSNVLINLS